MTPIYSSVYVYAKIDNKINTFLRQIISHRSTALVGPVTRGPRQLIRGQGASGKQCALVGAVLKPPKPWGANAAVTPTIACWLG